MVFCTADARNLQTAQVMSAEISTNRKALRDYHILEKIEAGISLKGTEVKSIRAGLVNLMGAFARVVQGELILYGMDIQPYLRASHEQHEPKRERKLLLHRREILKLHQDVTIKGRALVPLRLYWKAGRVKVELGVGKGKNKGDKREDLKARAVQRDLDREMAVVRRR
jgi:SsrA-binding protein